MLVFWFVGFTICVAKILLLRNAGWWGRAITQEVSRWLPTAAARVRARVWQVGFVLDNISAAGAGSLQVLRFPLPIFIPPNSPSSQSPWAGTLGHSLAEVSSGPRSNPHYANKKTLAGQVRVLAETHQ
jgi:hypothetical protein